VRALQAGSIPAPAATDNGSYVNPGGANAMGVRWRPGPAGAHERGRAQVTASLTVNDIARVIHEANSAMQVIIGEPVNPRWDDAPEWQRWACIDGVRDALQGLAPDEHHEAWALAMRREGWTYGPVKDGDAKTHPLLVPFEDLPPLQQAKDRLFLAIVAALREES
jgi:RyR domain